MKKIDIDTWGGGVILLQYKMCLPDAGEQLMDKIKITENNVSLEFAKTGKARLLSFGVGDKIFNSENGFPSSQIHLAGDNRNVHHGAKLYGARQSEDADFVGITEEGGAYVIVSRTDKLEIKQYFKFYDGVKGFKTYNEIKNISDGAVCAEEINSLFLHGLCKTDYVSADKNYVYIPHNSWHSEAQWKKYSLKELGLFNGNGGTNMKRINVSNNGTWSTKEFLPLAVLETEDKRFLLWQIESNGSWVYELGDYDNGLYLNIGGANFENNGWTKTLAPGESFAGRAAAVTFGDSLEEVFAEITKYRRAIRRKNKDNINIPLIYNSYMHCLWDYPTPKSLYPLIDAAAELGMEYFCIDAGWHDEDDWFSYIGCWNVSKKRFGCSLACVMDYIKSKGMKAGLWIEPECVGINSEFLKECGDECFLRRNGKPVIQHDRLFLDFTNKKVVARASELIDRLVGYGAEYIKIDYNSDVVFADGLEEHCRALENWLKGVYEKHPDLVIENCASGGCRMDYVMLKYNSVQSTSDQTDYRKYPYIAANVLTAVTPEQAAVWCYPIRGDLTPEEFAAMANGEEAALPDVSAVTCDDVVINVVNGLLGRMHLAGHIELLTGERKELVKEGLKVYNEIKRDKINGYPYMPNGFASFGDTFAASGFHNGDVYYLAVWNLGGSLSQSVNLGFAPESAEIIYPVSSEVRFVCEGQTLKLAFGKELQAAVFKIIKEKK